MAIKKLKGYLYAYRDRFELLAEKVLTHEEFILNDLGISLCDWDDRHANYGTFEATDQELATRLGLKSRSTAGVHRLSLIEKGFFNQFPNGRIKPKYFELWKHPKNEKGYSSVLNNEQGVRNIEQSEAETVSFNVSSNKELGRIELSDEEKEWIDREVKESRSSGTERFSKTLRPNLKTVDEMSWDEILITCKEIFGNQVTWDRSYEP